MTDPRTIADFFTWQQLHFWLSNRIPRRLATRFIGWFSRIEHPLVRDLSIATWRLFGEVDLADAERARFRSMHDCFTRALKPGSRPIDPDPSVIVSPCDAIVGACGLIGATTLVQAKGSPYTLEELLLDPDLASMYRDGTYVTLRLTSGMYHRFHAPHDATVAKVTYVSGDTWNVNPATLRRVKKVYCKNERVVIELRLDFNGRVITMVPVAAVLVASIRLHFLDVTLHLKYRGPKVIRCDAVLSKGEEMGWFEHGSTIIVIAPHGFGVTPRVRDGQRIRVGEPLLQTTTVERAAVVPG